MVIAVFSVMSNRQVTRSHRRSASTWSLGLLCALPMALINQGCSSEPPTPDVRSETAPVRVNAACTEDVTAVHPEAWLCPNPRIVECTQAEADAVETIYVNTEQTSCGALDPRVDEGPYGPGTHEIVVTDGDGDGAAGLCQATLQVVDTLPPKVESREVVLWPPNHKMHTVSIAECITAVDRCDESVSTRLLWVTSDEPENGIGDGNHEPDIVFVGCDGVQLRAERSGRGDGRVYELGYEVADSAGNVAAGVCRVVVPHNRASAAVPSEPVVRVEAPEACAPVEADAGAPIGPDAGIPFEPDAAGYSDGTHDAP
jgi:hypothetical protein